MAYQALYRKYRPDTFEKVVGQDSIVKTLKNQIIYRRMSHAYLFCGTRGTGKTSTAKLFAKAVNCLHPIEGEPCNQCEMCLAIQEDRSMNVIEMDAASNNGVDNIREIRDEVKYPPAEGYYKVYIIDEVHMLSTGAFNALLKTLEEPPEHVIFLLATTDPQKVPVTILSRCQRFDFKRVGSDCIMETLRKYMDEEQVDIEDKALHYIARLADGSMRDALSILDQCIAFYYQETITLEKVLDVVGSVDRQIFFDMAGALEKKDTEQALDIVEKLIAQGRDVGQFVWGLTEHYRNLLLVKTVGHAEKILDLGKEDMIQLSAQAKQISAEEMVDAIRVFSELFGRLKYAGNERVLLEVELVKRCSPLASRNVDALAAKVASLERKFREGSFTVGVQAPVQEAPKKKIRPKALPEDLAQAQKLWSGVVNTLGSSLKGLLVSSTLEKKDDEEGLTIVCIHENSQELVKKRLAEIEEAMDEKLGKHIKLSVDNKKSFEAWRRETYGEEEEDPEFDSLLQYFNKEDVDLEE